MWKYRLVVYGGGLENRFIERYPGFESLYFRHLKYFFMSQQISKFFSNSKNVYLLIIVGVIILISVLYIFTQLETKEITTNKVQETTSNEADNSSEDSQNSNPDGEILPGVQEPEPPVDLPEQTILPIN
jgi:hypothetical protein